MGRLLGVSSTFSPWLLPTEIRVWVSEWLKRPPTRNSKPDEWMEGMSSKNRSRRQKMWEVLSSNVYPKDPLLCPNLSLLFSECDDELIFFAFVIRNINTAATISGTWAKIFLPREPEMDAVVFFSCWCRLLVVDPVLAIGIFSSWNPVAGICGNKIAFCKMKMINRSFVNDNFAVDHNLLSWLRDGMCVWMHACTVGFDLSWPLKCFYSWSFYYFIFSWLRMQYAL